jgi:hypothetical protein
MRIERAIQRRSYEEGTVKSTVSIGGQKAAKR